MSIYDTLNKEQREAVFCTEGPLLMLAGAGSGKTRSLTHRIAYLIEEKGIAPWNILAITFTNKAAQEMRERVDSLVGYGSEDIWISTFHATCSRILRRHIDLLGYDRNFTIYDASDQKSLMKEVLKEMKIDTKQFPERSVMSEISSAKNEYKSPLDYRNEYGSNYRNQRIADIYECYQKRLKENNALDFDDLLVKMVDLFQANPEVLEHYQDRFRYIMVDEYQDTNPIQNDIIMLLAEPRNNLFCVGDDDQSIYGFRGAEPSIMLQFPKEFEHAKVIQLPLNYRCKENIVQASNRLISFNKNRYNKRILAARTENPTDADVIFHAYDKYSEECNYVKNVLLGNDKQAAMIGNVPYGDTACLFRTNRSVEKFAGKLIDSEIPFYSLEPLRNMLDHFVAKQIMAYFEVAMGNEKNLYEIVNRPVRYVEKRYVKPSTTLAQLKSIYANADSDKSYVYENLLKLEEDLHILKELGTPSKMIQYIFSEEGINYKKHLNNCSKIMHMTEEDIDDLKETTNQLYIFFRKYDTMDNLKKGIEQYTRMIQDAYKNQDRVGKVALTTIHSSKGLEYQRVIIFDVNEENLPYRKVDEKTDIEEERRLMYVAITRAKDQVIILYNNKNASQFVSQSQLAKSDFKVGDMILHKAFGKGRIVNTDSKYIQIEFPEKNRTMKFNFEYAITKNIIKKL